MPLNGATHRHVHEVGLLQMSSWWWPLRHTWWPHSDLQLPGGGCSNRASPSRCCLGQDRAMKLFPLPSSCYSQKFICGFSAATDLLLQNHRTTESAGMEGTHKDEIQLPALPRAILILLWGRRTDSSHGVRCVQSFLSGFLWILTGLIVQILTQFQ